MTHGNVQLFIILKIISIILILLKNIYSIEMIKPLTTKIILIIIDIPNNSINYNLLQEWIIIIDTIDHKFYNKLTNSIKLMFNIDIN